MRITAPPSINWWRCPLFANISSFRHFCCCCYCCCISRFICGCIDLVLWILREPSVFRYLIAPTTSNSHSLPSVVSPVHPYTLNVHFLAQSVALHHYQYTHSSHLAAPIVVQKSKRWSIHLSMYNKTVTRASQVNTHNTGWRAEKNIW